jgi:hypothetical protein
MVTFCTHVAVLPLPSVTVHVTFVSPTGNGAVGALLVTVGAGTLQLSATFVGEPTTMLPEHTPASVFPETAPGQVNVGFSASVMVTFCTHVAVLPWTSVTVHVTFVSPTGNVAGASLAEELECNPWQLSSVIGFPRATVLELHKPASASFVTFAGQVIVGFSASVMVTFCTHVAVLPWTSVTVHVTFVSPTGNVAGASLAEEPDCSPRQLSFVIGAPRTTPLELHKPGSVLFVTSCGHIIVGFSVSVTVTMNWQVLVCPT